MIVQVDHDITVSKLEILCFHLRKDISVILIELKCEARWKFYVKYNHADFGFQKMNSSLNWIR